MFAEFKVMADCQAFPEGQIVSSKVSQMPDHMAYWLRPRTGSPTIAAYLICRPTSLRGQSGSEAVRGWVAEQCLGKGVFVELMRVAAAEAGGMLVSDKDGMTEKSYTSWMGARGFSKRLFNRHTGTFHEISEIPREVHFSNVEGQGPLWRLILQLES
ncbi:MAG TPA: hypothetical protein VJ752_01755 [Burkholderiaceae bacterium]|nr:hypothetical protein [Burkholderiaceae bacterium]